VEADTVVADTVEDERTTAGSPAMGLDAGPHLVILDGVVMGPDFDPESLDPSDIERIEVSRVESGPRSGEGVIRITTKDGG